MELTLTVENTPEKKTGLIKWFSVEKGYGYITNRNNEDLYFGVKDIIGANLPEYGDKVEYEEYIGREEHLAAKDILILERKNPSFKKSIAKVARLKSNLSLGTLVELTTLK